MSRSCSCSCRDRTWGEGRCMGEGGRKIQRQVRCPQHLPMLPARQKQQPWGEGGTGRRRGRGRQGKRPAPESPPSPLPGQIKPQLRHSLRPPGPPGQRSHPPPLHDPHHPLAAPMAADHSLPLPCPPLDPLPQPPMRVPPDWTRSAAAWPGGRGHCHACRRAHQVQAS